METNKFVPKNPTFFCCSVCDYNTVSHKDFTKHCATQKHRRLTETNDLSQKIPKNPNQTFVCVCGNKYKHQSSLCKHRKTCSQYNAQEVTEYHDKIEKMEYQDKIDRLTNVVLDVVNKNTELVQQIVELSAKSTVSNSFNNMTTNNNNKTFNLQFFLNEECKDALNLRDFIESIQVQLTDLEHTGKVGYVEGISQILINNLGKLQTHFRPIHCSDIKREILYIKNENKWTKETEDKTTIKNAIKQIAGKNINQIQKWQEKYPDYNDPDSKQNDKYMHIVLNSMSGSTEEEQHNNINKIIRNVAKEVTIQK